MPAQRIKKLCAYLDACKTFADVACDHGYCTRYMLDNGLCEHATVSDISDKSLSKARALLSGYIEGGRCAAVCCDGLCGIDPATEQVLIAGIGGEEIVNILKNSFIPERFVFQPMKNAETLRRFLIGNGCGITADDVFSDGRNYYFVIKGARGGNTVGYTPARYAYGRDSLNNPVFKDYLRRELEKKREYLTRKMSREQSERLERQVRFMQGVLEGEID